MRTTISLDDNLGRAARRRARQEGLSLSALIARALAAHITAREQNDEAPPFRLVTVGGGGPRAGIDLDRTSEILVAEDEGLFIPRKQGS